MGVTLSEIRERLKGVNLLEVCDEDRDELTKFFSDCAKKLKKTTKNSVEFKLNLFYAHKLDSEGITPLKNFLLLDESIMMEKLIEFVESQIATKTKLQSLNFQSREIKKDTAKTMNMLETAKDNARFKDKCLIIEQLCSSETKGSLKVSEDLLTDAAGWYLQLIDSLEAKINKWKEDNQVYAFGSFTEEEVKSVLDTATLRSVSIVNNRPSETETAKKHQPSNLIKKKNIGKIVRTTAKASLVSAVHKNGDIHDPSSLSFSDGMKKPKQKNAELPVLLVAESAGDTEAVASPSSNQEQVIGSFEALEINDIKKNILPPSNGLHTTAIELLSRGLINPGYLCFMNATLQALLACSPFVNLLQKLRMHTIPKVGYPTLHAFVEFISSFDMPSDLLSKEKDNILLKIGEALQPVMFEPVLNNFTPDVPNSFSGRQRQEDAQEFLNFVMLQMDDELLKFEEANSNVNGGKVSLVSSVSDEDGDGWETDGPNNKTAITRTLSVPSRLSEIFGGNLSSVVRTIAHVQKIEDALHLYSEEETIEGYRPSSAGKDELVSASKSVKILELPEILILHLLRYNYGSQGSTKIMKDVFFPLELNLERQMLSQPTTEGPKYELIATITHHGWQPSMGHYTADVLHPSGQWLRYNDDSVVRISQKKVLHGKAYVLFYKQQ